LTRTSPSRWGFSLLLIAVCVISVAPFAYVLSASLKDSKSLFSYPPELIPSPLVLDNYANVFEQHPYARWVFNTLFVSAVVTGLKLWFDSMAAYALAKMDFPGRRSLYWTMLATLMVPQAILLIPLFFIVRDLGWLNTYWALIVPPLANPVGVLMLRAFIESVPDELERSARVDGCNAWQAYRRIVLPLIRPGLVVVGIYLFITQYQNFVWPLVVTNTEEMFMLTNGLATTTAKEPFVDWGLVSAGSMLMMIPITIVFLLFQRQFTSASLVGALKE
jgi:multiple sugar transport system permease protein